MIKRLFINMGSCPLAESKGQSFPAALFLPHLVKGFNIWKNHLVTGANRE
jgi:hypothetical protein